MKKKIFKNAVKILFNLFALVIIIAFAICCNIGILNYILKLKIVYMIIFNLSIITVVYYNILNTYYIIKYNLL